MARHARHAIHGAMRNKGKQSLNTSVRWLARERIASCSNVSKATAARRLPFAAMAFEPGTPQNARIHRAPLVWVFSSGVMLGTGGAMQASSQLKEAWSQLTSSGNLYEPFEEAYWMRAYDDAHMHPRCHQADGGCAVLDVGAALGYYSILTRLYAPSGVRIHAFNPHPTFVTELRQNLLFNRMDGNVCIHEVRRKLLGTWVNPLPESLEPCRRATPCSPPSPHPTRWQRVTVLASIKPSLTLVMGARWLTASGQMTLCASVPRRSMHGQYPIYH